MTGFVDGTGQYPADSLSLLRIDEPDVLLWSLKPAEEGITHGVIVRLWNQADSTGLTLRSTSPITSAMTSSHVETDIAPAMVTAGVMQETIGTQEMKTFRLFLADTVVTAVGSDPETVVNSLTISPNPAMERISIMLPEDNDAELDVRIHSVSGTRMYSGTWPVRGDADVIHVDVAGYPPGVYVVEVVGKARRFAGRFVKGG